MHAYLYYLLYFSLLFLTCFTKCDLKDIKILGNFNKKSPVCTNENVIITNVNAQYIEHMFTENFKIMQLVLQINMVRGFLNIFSLWIIREITWKYGLYMQMSKERWFFLFLKVHKNFNWIVSIKSLWYLYFVNILKTFSLDQYFPYIVNCILCNFKVHNNTSNCQHKSSEQIHGFRNTWDVCYQGWLKKIDVYCLQSVSWECGKGAWGCLIWRLSNV